MRVVRMGLFQHVLVENWTVNNNKKVVDKIVLPQLFYFFTFYSTDLLLKVKSRTGKDAILVMFLFRCCILSYTI